MADVLIGCVDDDWHVADWVCLIGMLPIGCVDTGHVADWVCRCRTDVLDQRQIWPKLPTLKRKTHRV